ncbi:DEAD/DEAH box helicase family protein [Nocardia takedensis]
MAKQVGAMGPAGIRVGQRLKDVRQSRGLTLNLLATRLSDLGRPIDLSALAKIEKGQRRVDVDDLMALARALDVSPNWLLFPETATNDRVDLTAAFSMTGREAWQWAVRDQPTDIVAVTAATAEVGTQLSRRSNFWFLQEEWPELYDQAVRAENFAHTDPRISCVYSRSALEMMLTFLYHNIGSGDEPKDATISAILSDPAVVGAIGPVHALARKIYQQGSAAVHGAGALPPAVGLATVVDLFNVMKWFARTYTFYTARLPDVESDFDFSGITQLDTARNQTPSPVDNTGLHESTDVTDSGRKDFEQVQILTVDINTEPAPERQRSRGDSESRTIFERLLEETEWTEGPSLARDYMLPDSEGSVHRFVDYVLWDDDQSPLALVEIGTNNLDPQEAFRQLQMIANDLKPESDRSPSLFYVNGSEVLIWDEITSSPRRVKGFFTKEELCRRLVTRSRRRNLNQTPIDEGLKLRDHQNRIVRDVCNAFEIEGRRNALVSMAPGSGKIGTYSALVELLIRADWVSRVLFLTDRRIVADQATEALRRHLPHLPISNDLRESNSDARIFVSSHHTLTSQVGETHEFEHSKYGHGFFDLIVIDELASAGSRAYFRIIDYFDALVVGFTSWPTDSIDNETLELFTVEGGTTSVYSFHDAVESGHAVAPEIIKVRITSDNEDGDRSISYLTSEDAVDSALKILLEMGMSASDGRVGKTIIFAQNASHAQLIAHRFRINYPDMESDFLLPVTSRTTSRHTSEIIQRFRDPEGMPRVAVSSGLLDTGIEVPEVVNLVFLKRVNSKGMFWQMLARGAQPAPNLLVDGHPKKAFRILDFCDNTDHLL